MQKRMLIVEDDFYIVDLYKELFSSSFPEYKIETEQDGQAALEKILTSYYDLVTLDIMLPTLHGLQILETLQHYKSPVGTIIMLSNLGQDRIIKKAYTLGAAGDIIKSNNTPDIIINKIREIIKSSSRETHDDQQTPVISKEKIDERITYAKNVVITE